MADDRPALRGDVPGEIDLLLFRSDDVNMAVDTDQVASIISAELAAQQAIQFEALSGLLGRPGAAAEATSKVLLFRDGEKTLGIGISELDSILSIKTDIIQPLPELLLHGGGLRPFWGVIPRGSAVVLLIDLFRLKGLITRRAETTA